MTRHEMHDIPDDPGRDGADHFVKESGRSITRVTTVGDPVPYTIHEQIPCRRTDCTATRKVIYVYSMDQIRGELGTDIVADDVTDLQIVEYLDDPIVQVAVGGTSITLEPADEIVEGPDSTCHGEDAFEQEPDAFDDDPYGQDPYEQPRM